MKLILFLIFLNVFFLISLFIFKSFCHLQTATLFWFTFQVDTTRVLLCYIKKRPLVAGFHLLTAVIDTLRLTT